MRRCERAPQERGSLQGLPASEQAEAQDGGRCDFERGLAASTYVAEAVRGPTAAVANAPTPRCGGRSWIQRDSLLMQGIERTALMLARPRTIDEYLSPLSTEKRAALGRLRETIRSTIPEAEECITYGIPSFRLAGVVVAGFCATAKGCSYFPFSGSTLGALAHELQAYGQTKSSLHFHPETPLPATLVRKLIKARIAERTSGASQGQPAAELISKRIAELGDWRGETLSRMRKLIKEADPDVVEEWKWRGTPIWSHDGIICTGESYKKVVKLTFAKGASLKDPARLFNSSLDGNARRAIDIHKEEEVNESAFKVLVRQAVALNSSGKSKPSKKAKS